MLKKIKKKIIKSTKKNNRNYLKKKIVYGGNDEYSDTLLNAIHNGNYEEMKTIIERDKDILNKPHSKTRQRILPIHQVLTSSRNINIGIRKNMIQLLIENEADINDPGNDGITPIFAAIDLNFNRIHKKEEVKDIIEFLIEKGANLNKITFSRNTPLFSAIDGGDLDLVTLFIEKGADINLDIDKENNRDIFPTPIFIALNKKEFHIIEYLINKGADLNKVNENDDNTLTFAINNDLDINTIKLLIDNKVKINDSNVKESPLWLAITKYKLKENQEELIKILLDNQVDLNKEISTEHKHIIITLLAKKINNDILKVIINHKHFETFEINKEYTHLNMKPLYAALINGDLDIIRLLIEKGAELEDKDITRFKINFKDDFKDDLKNILKLKTHGEKGEGEVEGEGAVEAKKKAKAKAEAAAAENDIKNIYKTHGKKCKNTKEGENKYGISLVKNKKGEEEKIHVICKRSKKIPVLGRKLKSTLKKKKGTLSFGKYGKKLAHPENKKKSECMNGPCWHRLSIMNKRKKSYKSWKKSLKKNKK